MPLLTRAARYRQADAMFLTTVNVFFMEIVKIIVASTFLIVSEKSITK